MSIAHLIDSFPGTAASASLPPEFVRRHRLVARLQSARDGALAIIVAPAGYGKSSLLAEWSEVEERPFIWGRPESLEDLGAAVEPDGDPCAVVLDDAHLVPGDTLRRSIASIQAGLPAGSIIVVATRCEPRLPLGALRAHRGLIEIRTRDLAMTPAEAGALLGRAGMECDFRTVQELVQRTEGWPAALYLAALASGERYDALSDVPGFRGDHHLLAEYVRDEVLGDLSRSSLTFLRRVSILDELSAEACDAILDETRSALRLASLARMTGLLEPLDPAHERYRCHPLFREALGAELRRRDPELVAPLHARASAWHAAHGRLEAAIDHATASADAERTGALAWSELPSLLTAEGIRRVRTWVEQFPAAQIAGSPALAMTAACGALAAGDGEAALGYARDLSVAARPSRSRATERAAAELIGALASGDRLDVIQRAAVRVRRGLPANSTWRAACRWLEGAATHLTGGERKRAAQALDEAVALAGRRFPALSVCALGHRAMLAIEDDDWELASDLTDEADAIVTGYRCELPMTALTLATIAAVRAHEGQAAEAKRDLHRATAALAAFDDAPAWFGAQTRLVLAHASLYLADVSGARALLAQASRQARRSEDVTTFAAWFADAWSYRDSIAETSLAGPSGLTIAELRVLRFLPSCRPFREIAEQLGVSANTVKTQAHAVYRKLGAGSRSEAVLLAREAGLLGQ